MAPNPNLSEEEVLLVNSLQELQKSGLELTDKQTAKLAELEQRQKALIPQRQLSHGHIHKHNRLQGQVAAAQDKIQKLDSEWQKLMAGISEKIKYHGTLYQSCRKNLVASYKEKVKELRDVQREMCAASETLMGNATDVMNCVVDLEDDDLARQLQEAEAFVQQVNQEVQMISDEEEEMVPAKDDVKTAPKKVFRGAQSPSKVANLHLKPKVETKDGKWVLTWIPVLLVGIFHRHLPMMSALR